MNFEPRVMGASDDNAFYSFLSLFLFLILLPSPFHVFFLLPSSDNFLLQSCPWVKCTADHRQPNDRPCTFSHNSRGAHIRVRGKKKAF